MIRKQVYFALISFVVLFTGLSIAHFVFGFSLSPGPQPPVVQPVETKPPFAFAFFFLILSLAILAGALFMFYISWFRDPDKIRENIQHTSEQLSYFHLRHDFSNINSNAFLWQVRLLSPIMILVGLVLVYVAIKAF